MTAYRYRLLSTSIVCLAALSSIATSLAQEQPGKLEIVRATAKKYASVPLTYKYDSPRCVASEGTTFLVIEVEATATFDENREVRREVLIESAKGNQRAPIEGVLEGNGWDVRKPETSFYSGGDPGISKAEGARYVFIVPEKTTEATLVMGDVRQNLSFPDAPVEYPPISSDTATVEILSSKTLTTAPVDDFAFQTFELNGQRVVLRPQYDPPYAKFVSVELAFRPKEPLSPHAPQSMSVWNEELCVTYGNGQPYFPLRKFSEVDLPNDDGRLPERKQEVLFGAPKGAKEGTLYWRQTPIGTFQVGK